jgi:hypothetical protein
MLSIRTVALLSRTGGCGQVFSAIIGTAHSYESGVNGKPRDESNSMAWRFDLAEVSMINLQPGILYSIKGAKADGSDDKINLSYVEVPVNFVYKPELGAGRLILGFGPYVAYAVSGKFKYDNGSDEDIEFENEITPIQAAAGNYVKPLDAGANLLFGYEFANKLSLQLNAGLGLVNINPKVEGIDTDAKTKNTGFGVSLGYRF